MAFFHVFVLLSNTIHLIYYIFFSEKKKKEKLSEFVLKSIMGSEK